VKTPVNLILLSLILLSFGCDYVCSDRYLNLAFVGFDSAEVNKIVLKQYKTNTAFQNPIDTFLITNEDGLNPGNLAYIYTTIDDTTVIFNNQGNQASITDGYDWSIFIPAMDSTIYISNILRTPGNGTHGCLNPIISFMQDSSIITPIWISTDQFWTSGYRIYIYK
jgi:hypothetical protein